MEIKAGDKIELVGIAWDEHHWEFDHPTVVLEPIIKYSPNGVCCETMFEDLAIDMSIEERMPKSEDISQEFDWRGWKLNRLKQVVRERFAGKDTWKTKIRECVKQTIEFYEDDGELHFKVLKTETA